MEKMVPVQRVLQRVDEAYSHNHYEEAEKILLYWVDEAKQMDDKRGLLSLYNELMGHYRKTANEEKAEECAQNALELIETQQIEETVSAATIFINCATVKTAFSKWEEAMPLFENAKGIYEAQLDSTDEKLGSLYNNMATALKNAKRYDEAIENYEKAIEIMKHIPDGELEQAITYLNLANLKEAQLGLEEACGIINEYLEKAQKLLDTPTLSKNGYYAFVCDKCAPGFDYYGFFAYAEELRERVQYIYERD
ncbi:MAG: tetratricopeptide repeat protein [Clostridia bacterium]|nr:tetratricopeptide repeat protein [Clostridia bacterium]